MGTGGVGNQIYNITTRLKKHDYNIKVISLRPLGRFGKQTTASGIDATSLKIDDKITFPIVLNQLRKIICSFDPDIIHTHLFHASILGRIASLNTNTTVITTIHNTYDKNPDEKTKTMRDYLYQLTDSTTTLVTFVSKGARDRYQRVGAVSPEKSVHVPNGIDTEMFEKESEGSEINEEFVWITVGNLQEQKGHEVLLEAVSILSNSNDDFRVNIIGEGELRSHLESTAQKLSVSIITNFMGRVDSIPPHLNNATAFVLPSLWEGFGLVVGEAMACELPVVATDTSGPSEIIVDGETGFLAERGSPEDLASQMKKMMQLSLNERAAFGAQGRQRIKNKYSIEQTVSKWIDIYEKALSS